MQDRFKFRVFDKENGEMFYPTKEDEYIEIDANGDLIGINLEGLWCGGLNCILMQCTGLEDKSDKLIYEGDILKFKLLEDFAAFGTNEKYVEIIAPVIYEYGGFFIEQSENSIFLGQLPMSEIEVVGNIYENPKLLKEVK